LVIIVILTIRSGIV